MKLLKLRKQLSDIGLLLLEDGKGWLVTNNGTAKTLIEHEFADLEAVKANRFTDEEYTIFVHQCDGLPLKAGIHQGSGLGCTRNRYEE